MLMFCKYKEQKTNIKISNMSPWTVYTEEKEHASTSCFGIWGAQRHITAADTLRSALRCGARPRGAFKGKRSRATSAHWLRLRSANVV